MGIVSQEVGSKQCLVEAGGGDSVSGEEMQMWGPEWGHMGTVRSE